LGGVTAQDYRTIESDASADSSAAAEAGLESPAQVGAHRVLARVRCDLAGIGKAKGQGVGGAEIG
jgi:hypothetical protein